MSGDDIRRALGDKRESIHSLGVIQLRLFGSVRSGTARADSDIDFLVDFAPGRKNFDSYMDLKILLEDLFPGHRIDLITTESLHPRLRSTVTAQAEHVA